jgi:Zn-dependent protease with chaperone function
MNENHPTTDPINLTLGDLTLPKERTYFVWVLVLSIIIWAGLAATIIGLAYAALFAFFLWLGNGLLIAHLRSGAVKVSEVQMPELHASFREVCERLGFTTIPGLYVLQAGGALNAFATRHVGRDFVVVYSDFLEALGASSPEMKFILGHEIGHIRSQHILKQILLAPGMFIPLVGPAYRRSWESSCDRHGAFAAQDLNGAVRAMMVLGGGKGAGRSLDAKAFADQYTDERGFFVSLNELTSTYPTLSRRVSDILSLKTGSSYVKAKRSSLAYFPALFIPGGGGGATTPANALVIMVMMGLLAAMAIPAFQKVRQASQAKVCINNGRILEAALDQYLLEHHAGATSWDEIVGPKKLLPAMPKCPAGGVYSAQYAQGTGYVITCSVHNHEGQAPSSAGGK